MSVLKVKLFQVSHRLGLFLPFTKIVMRKIHYSSINNAYKKDIACFIENF